jgi:hypothetical protein
MAIYVYLTSSESFAYRLQLCFLAPHTGFLMLFIDVGTILRADRVSFTSLVETGLNAAYSEIDDIVYDGQIAPEKGTRQINLFANWVR